MARKQKKYHFIYKTVNNITGKYYYGMHSTDDFDDGYMGSGKRLRYSINKYGKDNHTKEIIEYCNSRIELKAKEEQIVNLKEIAKRECMNLQPGGGGGFTSRKHMMKCSKAGNEAFIKRLKTDPDLLLKYQKLARIRLNKIKTEGKTYSWTGYEFQGKHHSSESKQKMSESHKGKHKGELNSQYGTRWITNGKSDKKIKNKDKIPKGWYLGRKI